MKIKRSWLLPIVLWAYFITAYVLYAYFNMAWVNTFELPAGPRSDSRIFRLVCRGQIPLSRSVEAKTARLVC